MRPFVLPPRADWESYESQFVTLAIDFRLRRAFTGPPKQLAVASTCCHIKRPGFALKAAPKYFSRKHSVTQEPASSPLRRFPDTSGQEKVYRNGTLCAL